MYTFDADIIHLFRIYDHIQTLLLPYCSVETVYTSLCSSITCPYLMPSVNMLLFEHLIALISFKNNKWVYRVPNFIKAE